MERFSITFILVAILATCVFSTRPGTNYYRRHSQKRQAYYGNHPYSNNGNTGACGITINVGGTSNGCNCACAPQGGEGPAPAPPPSAGDPIFSSEPEVHYPPSSAEECGSQNPFCNDELAPAAPSVADTGSDSGASDPVVESEKRKGDYCMETEGCLTCGWNNPSRCDVGDGNATIGQCIFEWSTDQFRERYCSSAPTCATNCSRY